MNNKKTYEKNKKVGIICTKPILLKKGNAKSKEYYKNNKDYKKQAQTSYRNPAEELIDKKKKHERNRHKNTSEEDGN